MLPETFLGNRLRVSADNDDDFVFRIVIGEIDGLLSFFGDGKAGKPDIRLAGTNRVDDGVKFDILDFERASEIVRDVFANFDVDSDDAFSRVVFVGRELRIGREDELWRVR